MSNKPVKATLWALGRLNGPPTPYKLPLRRHFSSSSVRGSRSTFTKTENAELDNVLADIQDKIILPAYLPPRQRKDVFDAKKRLQLVRNPIVLELDGEEFKFMPLDKLKDIPNYRQSMTKAVEKFQSREEWANLDPLLAGFKKARFRLSGNDLGKIARLAGKTGNIYSVIECAKQSGRTGFKLTQLETVVQILEAINLKIINSNWDAAETLQAVKQIDIVLDLLERPENTLKQLNNEDNPDSLPPLPALQFFPLIRGLVLFAKASLVRAQKQKGSETDAAVISLKDEVELIQSLWARAADSSTTEMLLTLLRPRRHDASTTLVYPGQRRVSESSYMQLLAQNIRAMEMVADGGAEDGLASIRELLEQHLDKYARVTITFTDKENDWVEMYKSAMGREPSWAEAGFKQTGGEAQRSPKDES